MKKEEQQFQKKTKVLKMLYSAIFEFHGTII